MPDNSPSRKTILDRALSIAAEVRPGEGATAMLLSVNGFLLLAAYYTIRPVRSALLLPVEIPLPGGRVMAGPEIQSYTGAILAALFLFIVPLYSAFANRFDRIRLINVVTMFFVVTLIGFFVVGRLGAFPTLLAVTFFLGAAIAISSMTLVSQLAGRSLGEPGARTKARTFISAGLLVLGTLRLVERFF